MKNSLDGVSNQDILEAIQDFASHVDKQFVATRAEFKSDLAKLETRIVTKDYLDRKLATYHSDLVLRMQKEDKKTLELAKTK